MIAAEQLDMKLDQVAGVPGARPKSASGVAGALRDLFARFDRLAGSRSAFPIQRKPTVLNNAPVAAFAGAFLGCLTTLCFSAVGIVPGIASALATALLCGQLLVTRTTRLFAGVFFPALYGGTFGGMTPIFWLGDGASGHSAALTGALSVSLSVVCGLAFFVVVKFDTRSAAPIGAGYGGRLGAIATVASFLFVELVRPLGADVDRFHSIEAGALDVAPWSAILEFLACLVGIFGTLFVLRHQRVAAAGVPEKIFIASAVALVGLMILHLGSPNDARMLDAYYAGCFLGMSTPDRLKGWVQAVLGAVVLTVLLVPVRAFMPGFGGSLGLAAFASGMLLVAFGRATDFTTREMLTSNSSLGTALANVMIAVSLGLGSLPHWSSATPDRLAEEAAGSIGTPGSEPITESPARTLAQLVIDKAAPGAGDEAIPLGISLMNAADDDVVILSDLPPGSSITSGRPSATGEWLLSARELANAAIRPAHSFVGGTDATVELRRADRTIDRQALHLEWTGPVRRATTAVETPLVVAPSTGKPPDQVTDDHEALFRAFLDYTTRQHPRRAEPGSRTAHAARPGISGIAAGDRRVGGQGAAAPTGPQHSALPVDRGVVRPVQPLARHGDHAAGPKATLPKNSPPRPNLDRQIPGSTAR
jgi:hypothetical protein